MEQLLFEKYYKQYNARANITKPNSNTYNTIPIFYQKLPKNPASLGQKLREEARTIFLQKRSKELMDNNELKALWALLEQHNTLPAVSNEQYINYDDYLKVAELAGEKSKYVIRFLLDS